MESMLAAILRKHHPHFGKVTPFDWAIEPILVLDLTESNIELQSVNLDDTAAFSEYVFGKMAQADARVAVGGYNENRYIYRRSAHFSHPDEPRSVHLGIDIWAEAGTPVFAPLEGKIHSFQHNDHFGDYGPTIILEHQLDGITFYTLYGHLNVECLVGLHRGKPIRQGEPLAAIGNYPVNGDWPPHLHFQVIADMQGRRGDFPGVCSLRERETWLAICPDANLILGIGQLS